MSESVMRVPFDPARYLTLISGKEYLEVKWRLVWLRSEHPEAHIVTELVSHGNSEAVFKASIRIPGGAEATGWGSEDTQGFGDYLEKAETKAIGRALGALGYGTQFAEEFTESVRTHVPDRAETDPVGVIQDGASAGPGDRKVTDQEANAVRNLSIKAVSKGSISYQDIGQMIQTLTGVEGSKANDLTISQASTVASALADLIAS